MQAKNLRRNTLKKNHCSGVLADQPLSKGGHGISTGLWNRRWCTENKTLTRRNLILIKVITDGMLSWLCIFHLAVCITQGIKAPRKIKVNGSRSKKLGHPMSLYLFIYLSSFADVVHPEDIPGLCWGWTSAEMNVFGCQTGEEDGQGYLRDCLAETLSVSFLFPAFLW